MFAARIGMAAVAFAATAAHADTAAPFALTFGRLVEPGVPAANPAAGSPAVLPSPDRDAALECLATAIVHEAGHEPAAGQAAVAQVILNRVGHPAFPKTACGVVYQGRERRTGCQFSFTCDGSLARRYGPRIWAAARGAAAAVLDGRRDAQVGAATHYHASYVSPYWAPALVRVAAIGAHIFYRFPGRAGPAAPAATASPGAAAPPAVFAPWGIILPPAATPGTM